MGKTKINNKKIYLLVFGLTLLLKILFMMQNADYGINPDRMGDLAAPTALAGLDWSALISQVGYYGYGFKWIYFIFFKLTSDPYKIYWAITVMYSLLMSFLAVLIYIIADRLLRVEQRWLSVALAVYMGAIGSCDMKSESSVYLATWVIAFLILKLCGITDKKRKCIITVVLALFFSYAVTLHARMTAAIIGFVILIILYRIKSGKWLVPLGVYIPAQGLFYWLEETISNRYRMYFWGNATVKNSSVISIAGTSDNFYFLESLRGFKIAVGSVVSNIFTLGMQTLGIGWIAIAIFAFSILFYKMRLRSENKEKSTDRGQKDQSLYVLLWYFGICTAIVIAGIAVNWGQRVYAGNIYNYKGFVYARYYMNFVYPAMFAAVAWITQHKAKANLVLFTWICGIVGVVLFLWQIFPKLQEVYVAYVPQWNTSTTSLPWVLYDEFIPEASVSSNLVINLVIVMLVMAIVTLMVLGKRMEKGLLILLFLPMLYAQTAGFHFAKPNVTLSADVYKNTYEFVHQLENQQILTEGMEIYAEDGPWTLQYMLPHYKIQRGYPQSENSILVSSVSPSAVLGAFEGSEDYYVYQVSASEFFYTDSENLRMEVERFTGNQMQPICDFVSATSGFSQAINEKTMAVAGIKSNYKIVVLNDLHLICPNEEVGSEYKELVDSRYASMMTDESGIPSADHWMEMVQNVNSQNPNLVVLAGDMVDYASQANYDLLKQGIDVINAPVMYIRSDHDESLHYTHSSLSKEDVSLMSESLDGDPEIWNYDLGEVRVVGINRSWEPLTDEALEQLKSIFAEDKPIVLVTHVPYDSPIDSDFRERSYQNRKIYNMWGVNDRYEPDANMNEFLDMLYADNNPVCAVIAGHLHYSDEVMLSKNLKEYMLAPDYENRITVFSLIAE